jgi:hypothetical protein
MAMSSERPSIGQPKPEVLLVEYQAAQASAQHHDQLVWTITSILWGSSLVLFGLAVGALGSSNLRIPVTIVAVVAMALTVYLWLCVRQLRGVKVHKYKRCLAIERELGMKQHSTLQYAAGSQTLWYSVIMVVFLALWVSLVVWAWVGPS